MNPLSPLPPGARLLKMIQGGPVFLRADGAIEFTADADIDSDGGPNVDDDPCWQAQTSYRYLGRSLNAQIIPYVVIPIGILDLVAPVGLGCAVTCTHTLTGKCGHGILGDLGPSTKDGEISAAMARLLGVNPNSRTGGESRRVIRYEVFIGKPAVLNGITYPLQPLHRA